MGGSKNLLKSMAMNPSQVTLAAVRMVSGSPFVRATQVAMKLLFMGSSSSSMPANRVPLQKAVPTPPGSPGAAIVKRTRAGQATSIMVQVIWRS